MLNIWGTKSSKLCRFCCKDTESIEHLFWYCPQVACFWSQVQEWLKMHSSDLILTLEIVLLEYLERPGQSITNIPILLVTVFIFNSQSVDSIRLDRLKLYVKHHSIVERYMLSRNPKRVASRDRWDGLRVGIWNWKQVLSLMSVVVSYYVFFCIVVCCFLLSFSL